MKTIKVLAGADGSRSAWWQAPPKADEVRIGLDVYIVGGRLLRSAEQARDGFLLAVEQLGGQLGGLDAEIIVVDERAENPMSP